MLDKILYNTVLCQAFSNCGKYLIAGNIYSQLAVFDLNTVLNPDLDPLTTQLRTPKFLHTIEDAQQICSLVSTKKFLILGTVKHIIGWDWKSVIGPKLGKPSWSISIPSKCTSLEQLDVNSMWLSDDEERLYAGCGDNNIYCYSLEDGKEIRSYEGHTDYLHCVHGKDEQIISASEDGTVRLWDSRTKNSRYSIEPHNNSQVARPEIGKWVGAVALGEDWIVCGGGPRASLWHLRSLDAVTVFDIPDKGIHVSFFHDDCVVLGGAARHLYQACYSGEVSVQLPVSSTTVYSAIMRTTPNKVLAIAGSSMNIDLCSTFSYRDQILQFR